MHTNVGKCSRKTANPRLYISPERPDLRAKLSRILDLTQFGDWMMLYLIAKNTDRVIFGQVINNEICSRQAR